MHHLTNLIYLKEINVLIMFFCLFLLLFDCVCVFFVLFCYFSIDLGTLGFGHHITNTVALL